MKQNIFGITLTKLQEVLSVWGVPSYRAQQICEWMYQKNVLSFSDMTNLPLALREILTKNLVIFRTKLIARQDSEDCKTSKFLLGFSDDVAVETVLMRQAYGNTICVSTQAGCSMGCIFCASTVNGMVRNLTASEILAQALFINELLKAEDQQVNNIVIMGSGEPLMNYVPVIDFIHLSHEVYCMNMGYRNITLSTSGIVPMIKKLITEKLPITLSISLHAPNNELRSKLMPINEKYPIEEVVAAGKLYADETKRRVTYEYILIDDVNDDLQMAESLWHLIKGQMASVNLIPINPVVEHNLNRPSNQKVKAFEDFLIKHHIAVTVRREMGNDIQAACGQLRNQHLQ